jgi:hypothetical protein
MSKDSDTVVNIYETLCHVGTWTVGNNSLAMRRHE